jgi:hypothetical protein
MKVAETPKRRGRPPKAKVEEQPKKRRGRPPKNREVEVEEPVKRKRGRPPKAKVATEEVVRRRGRPPKHRDDDDDAPTTKKFKKKLKKSKIKSAPTAPHKGRERTAKQLVFELLSRGAYSRDKLAAKIIKAGLTGNKDEEKVKNYVSVMLSQMKKKDGIPLVKTPDGKFRIKD